MGIGGIGLSALSSQPASGSDEGGSDRAQCGQSEGQAQWTSKSWPLDGPRAFAMAEAWLAEQAWRYFAM